MRTLTTSNDTYTRKAHGVWRYPWGHPVPSAVDLTLADLMAIDGTVGCTEAIRHLRRRDGEDRNREAAGTVALPDTVPAA